MMNVIETALDQHLARTRDELWRRHEEFVAQQAARGRRVAVHESPEPVDVYIDHGKWVIRCECGAGNAADPDANEARCFACGAVHTAVVFPEERIAVEALLLARPNSLTRNWWPPSEWAARGLTPPHGSGESLDDLATDNTAHGVELDEAATQVASAAMQRVAVKSAPQGGTDAVE
jgi:hypothetical protein